jgi:hypothetical protein
MTKAVTNKGTTAMSALVVRSLKLEDLINAMDEIKTSLPAGEIAEIANINSVRFNSFSPGVLLLFSIISLILKFLIVLTNIVIPSGDQRKSKGS